MPCLRVSSTDSLSVQGMHEVVFVNRGLAERPTVELHVVAIVNVEAAPSVLRFAHGGRIGPPKDMTPRWADYAAGKNQAGLQWYAETVFNSSWGQRGKLFPRSPELFKWECPEAKHAEEVSVWPDQVNMDKKVVHAPDEESPIYSYFEVAFAQRGKQVMGFSFSTEHGIERIDSDAFEVNVEGPDRAAIWVRDKICKSMAGDDRRRSEALDKVSDLWFLNPCLSADRAYSVTVMPHPGLKATPLWDVDGIPPPPGQWLEIPVDDAPADMAFADPHSTSRALGLYPIDTKFRAQIAYRLSESQPSAEFLEIMSIWDTI